MKIQAYDNFLSWYVKPRGVVEWVMDYQAVWKVLEEIILEIWKKGLAAPQAIMNDLK